MQRFLLLFLAGRQVYQAPLAPLVQRGLFGLVCTDVHPAPSFSLFVCPALWMLKRNVGWGALRMYCVIGLGYLRERWPPVNVWAWPTTVSRGRAPPTEEDWDARGRACRSRDRTWSRRRARRRPDNSENRNQSVSRLRLDPLDLNPLFILYPTNGDVHYFPGTGGGFTRCLQSQGRDGMLFRLGGDLKHTGMFRHSAVHVFIRLVLPAWSH